MRHHFIAKQAEYDFGIAWVYKGRPWMEAIGEGLTTAHDCIEHFADDTGRPEDELQAIGAMFWTRQYADTSDNFYRFERIIGTELTNQYHQYAYDSVLSNCKARYCSVSEQIEDAIQCAYATAGYDDETLRKTNWDTPEQRRRLKAWMIRGYQRARRRYPNQLFVGSLFDNIRRTLPKPEYEGEELIIQYRNNNSEVRFIRQKTYHYY